MKLFQKKSGQTQCKHWRNHQNSKSDYTNKCCTVYWCDSLDVSRLSVHCFSERSWWQRKWLNVLGAVTLHQRQSTRHSSQLHASITDHTMHIRKSLNELSSHSALPAQPEAATDNQRQKVSKPTSLFSRHHHHSHCPSEWGPAPVKAADSNVCSPRVANKYVSGCTVNGIINL